MDGERTARGRPLSVRRRRAVGACLLALLAACARPGPTLVPRLDLIEEFEHTDVARERDHIALGTPDGDSSLVEGWSTATDGVVRATERRATVRIVLGAPADRTL